MDAVDSGRKALIMRVLGLLLGQPRYVAGLYERACESLYCNTTDYYSLFMVSYWVQCGQPPRTGYPSLLVCPLFVYIILEMPMNIGLAGCFGLWLLAV